MLHVTLTRSLEYEESLAIACAGAGALEWQESAHSLAYSLTCVLPDSLVYEESAHSIEESSHSCAALALALVHGFAHSLVCYVHGSGFE